MLNLWRLCFSSSPAAVEDRKLFIGMVSKKCNENDIRVMFSAFGQIEECRILRGPDGLSRGVCVSLGLTPTHTHTRTVTLLTMWILLPERPPAAAAVHCVDSGRDSDSNPVTIWSAGWLKTVSEPMAACRRTNNFFKSHCFFGWRKKKASKKHQPKHFLVQPLGVFLGNFKVFLNNQRLICMFSTVCVCFSLLTSFLLEDFFPELSMSKEDVCLR